MRRTVVAVVVGAVLLAACAGSDPGASPEPSAASTVTDAPSPAPSQDATAPEVDGPFDAVAPPAPPDGPPARFIGVRSDGEVVEAATATGATVRVLASYDDPRASDADGMGHYADGVTVDPAGRWLLVDTCCEPAIGWADRYDLATGGLDAEGGSHGVSHSIGPGGRTAFTVGSIVHLRSGDGTSLDYPAGREDPFSGGERFHEPAWSADGSRIVVLRDSEDVGSTEVIVFEVPSLEVVGSIAAAGAWTYRAPVFRRDGRVLVAKVEMTGEGVVADLGAFVYEPDTFEVVAEFPYGRAVQSQQYDPSHTFLLTTYDDGSLEWRGLGRSGVIANDGFLDGAWVPGS